MFTPTQQRALDLLASGMRLHAVAAACSISRMTLWRWKQDAAFAAELGERVRRGVAELRAPHLAVFQELAAARVREMGKTAVLATFQDIRC